MKDIHPASKAMMLAVWVDDGQAIRDSVDNDLLLCDALRNILPPYQAPLNCSIAERVHWPVDAGFMDFPGQPIEARPNPSRATTVA